MILIDLFFIGVENTTATLSDCLSLSPSLNVLTARKGGGGKDKGQGGPPRTQGVLVTHARGRAAHPAPHHRLPRPPPANKRVGGLGHVFFGQVLNVERERGGGGGKGDLKKKKRSVLEHVRGQGGGGGCNGLAGPARCVPPPTL
jgi:hypothetical protein